MRVCFLAICGFPIVACNGVVERSPADGAADAADAPDADPCPNLENRLFEMRRSLRGCSVFGTVCAYMVNDVCCPLAVNTSDVGEFEALAAQYKAECHPTCTPCPPSQPGTCTYSSEHVMPTCCICD